MSETIDLQYGMCDIFVGGSQEFKFLGDAAEFSAEPQFENIDLYELPNYDKLLVGYDVKFKVVLEDYSYDNLKLAMPQLAELKDISDNVVGMTDGGINNRMRDKAVELTIHPRDLESSNKKFDLTIFKAFPVSVYEKKFGKELSKYEVEFTAFTRTTDPRAIGNYFRIGEPAAE